MINNVCVSLNQSKTVVNSLSLRITTFMMKGGQVDKAKEAIIPLKLIIINPNLNLFIM